jgi:hypothetical protein
MTIIKVGGSLFDFPDLVPRLDLLIQMLGTPVMLVPGGGGYAEEVRRLDAIHGWPAATSHQLALHAMSMTARLLAALSPRYHHVTDPSGILSSWTQRRVPVLDVAKMPGIEALPESWDVTSDSIAAWISQRYGFGRLVLAKSVELPNPAPTPQDAAERGLVDLYFPRIASGLEGLGWTNLRSEYPRLTWWFDNTVSGRRRQYRQPPSCPTI